jgi:hypothetical protein
MRYLLVVLLNKTKEGYWSKESAKEVDFLRVEVVADILDGCDANCLGCFVPRRNKTSDLYNLYNVLAKSSFAVDELVIGPTDIFDATNFHLLMSDKFMSLLYKETSIAYTTALKQDINIIKRKLDIIWSVYDDDTIRDIEFKIVLSIDDLLNDTMPDEKLELFKNGSVQFRVNYYKGMFDNISYNEICEKSLRLYNTPVTIVPSFLNNSNNTGKVSELLKHFKQDLIDQKISPEYLDWYTMFDPNFNSYGSSSFSFFGNKLYTSPFIFDNILQRSSEFIIDDINKSTLADNLKVSPCGNCEFTMSCAERNVHLYMHSRGLTDCILPKEYMHANN